MQTKVIDKTLENAQPLVENKIISLHQNHHAILGRLENDDQSHSGRVTDIIDRYAVMIAESLPDLSDDEWLSICDCYAGVIDSTSGIHMIPSVIFNEASNLESRWDVDAKLLAERIREMSFAEQVAIAEFLDRFWMRRELHHGVSSSGETIVRIKQSIIEWRKSWVDIVGGSEDAHPTY